MAGRKNRAQKRPRFISLHEFEAARAREYPESPRQDPDNQMGPLLWTKEAYDIATRSIINYNGPIEKPNEVADERIVSNDGSGPAERPVETIDERVEHGLIERPNVTLDSEIPSNNDTSLQRPVSWTRNPYGPIQRPNKLPRSNATFTPFGSFELVPRDLPEDFMEGKSPHSHE